jgi:hypothetical protein
MSEEQQASNLAIQVITSMLRPSRHEILLASLVKNYASRHPEEFQRAVKEISEKIDHQMGTPQKGNQESSEFFSDLVIRARGIAWEIMASLDRSGALPEHPSILFQMVRANPRLKTIPDDSMQIIAEQTYHGYTNSKQGDHRNE